MKTMRKRIFTGIITAALAIVPFTGTGIDAVDKELTKDTAITANASGHSYKGGVYRVNETHWVGWTYHHKKGEYIGLSDGGFYRGVDVKDEIDAGWISFAWR